MTVFNRLLWIVLLSCATPIWAGTVEGWVTDEEGQPVADVLIYLTGEEGEELTVYTDDAGFFRFDSVSDGWYALGLVEPPGYLLVSPPCGYHQLEVRGPETIQASFGLAKRGSGVVVEFGKPSGVDTDEISITVENTFDVGLFAYQLSSFFPTLADRMVIRGRWLVPGIGPIDADITHADPAGAYALGNGLDVTFTNLPGHSVEIELVHRKWPHLDRDGLMALLHFQINTGGLDLDLSGRRVVFCMDRVSLHWRFSALQWSTQAHTTAFE